MNKNRLETLSDGVFAIVMTLLVIEIVVPELHSASDRELWEALSHLGPLFVGYFVSFAVLAMFWIAHNFFYGAFTKNVNRVLVLLNILYLSFVALIPFSAHLLGEYSTSRLAIFLYGLNVFIIGILAWIVLRYALNSKEIDTDHLSRRLLVSGADPFGAHSGLYRFGDAGGLDKHSSRPFPLYFSDRIQYHSRTSGSTRASPRVEFRLKRRA